MSTSPANVTLENPPDAARRPARRRRGRPLEMSPETLLQRIRTRHSSDQLFRVHVAEPALYARARRLFGSWARALAAAGIDHASAVAAARRRALLARRRRPN